jgi:hypothetical protein
MVIQHATATLGGVTAIGVAGEIVVRTSGELASALRQRKKLVVIENAEMEARFQKLLAWREARNWFVAVLGAGLLAYAISRDYKIEASFEKDWKIERSNAKITLTPPQQR